MVSNFRRSHLSCSAEWRAGANALFIPSGKWRGNTIVAIVRRVIIRWRDRQFDEPRCECRVIGRIGWCRLRRHRGALLFGRADDKRVLTGRKFGRRMLSLASCASRYSVQIGKCLLKSLNFEAMR
jgi:hypothetical protein